MIKCFKKYSNFREAVIISFPKESFYMRYLLISLLFCSFLSAETPPQEVLKDIYESYYDYDEVGLNRVSCLVKSPEIFEKFDSKAKKNLSKIKIEAVMVPGKTIDIRPHETVNLKRGGPEMMAAQTFSSKTERWLTQIFDHLESVPEYINPENLSQYKFSWVEGEEGKIMKLTMEEAEQNNVKDQPLKKEKEKERLKGAPQKGKAKNKGKNKKVVNVKNNPMPFQQKKANQGPKGNMEIQLTSSGYLHKIIFEKGEESEDIRIKTKKSGKKWLIEDFDVAKFDDQKRLIERNLIRYNYITRSGVVVPQKVTLKALDSKGRLVDRREEANPVTIIFSGHQVEVRK